MCVWFRVSLASASLSCPTNFDTTPYVSRNSSLCNHIGTSHFLSVHPLPTSGLFNIWLQQMQASVCSGLLSGCRKCRHSHLSFSNLWSPAAPTAALLLDTQSLKGEHMCTCIFVFVLTYVQSKVRFMGVCMTGINRPKRLSRVCVRCFSGSASRSRPSLSLPN